MTAPVAATVFLADLEPAPWRQMRRALCAWQARGQAQLEVAGVPLDLVSIATAETSADLPHRSGGAPVEIVVFDAQLAGSLIRLAAEVARRREGPPP